LGNDKNADASFNFLIACYGYFLSIKVDKANLITTLFIHIKVIGKMVAVYLPPIEIVASLCLEDWVSSKSTRKVGLTVN